MLNGEEDISMAGNGLSDEGRGDDRRSGGRQDEGTQSEGFQGGDRRSGGRSKGTRSDDMRSYSARDDEQLVETVVLFKKNVQELRNRRRKKDWVTWMSSIMTIVAWMTMLAVWITIDAASPEIEWSFLAGFGRVHFGMEPVLRDTWDFALVYIAFILLVASIVMSIIALVFNLLRKRRKTDKIKKSIIVTGGITIVILVFFLMNFHRVLF